MAKYEGRGRCDRCDSAVEVYSDKNGLAYYKCGPCGLLARDTKMQKSAAFLNTIDRFAEEDAAPEKQGIPDDQKMAGPVPLKPEKSSETQKKTGFRIPSLMD